MIHLVVDLFNNKVDTKGKENDTEKFVFFQRDLTHAEAILEFSWE